MTNIKAISIPEPCHQSWQQMTEANNGRHCAHCCKTVVDFTEMGNEEIVNHLSNASHVCGRFGQQQLAIINYELYTRNLPKASWWKRVAMIVAILGPVSLKVNAQSTSTSKQLDTIKSYDKAHDNHRGSTLTPPGETNVKKLSDTPNDTCKIGKTINLNQVDIISTRDSIQHRTEILGGATIVVIRQSLSKRIWQKIKSIF